MASNAGEITITVRVRFSLWTLVKLWFVPRELRDRFYEVIEGAERAATGPTER